MRVEIVEECEHGEVGEHNWFTPKQRRLRACPGGSRREASESELLTLVADLAEKVWWCEEHEAGGNDECWYADIVYIERGTGPESPCRMVERFLLPVGVSVDGSNPMSPV